MPPQPPRFGRVDHVGLTVPDLGAAIAFYRDAFGATELFRLGPFDASEMPPMPDGRDWTEAHIDVPGARLSIAMLELGPDTKLELFQYDRPEDARRAPPRNCDVGGHHVAFAVDDLEAATAHLAEHGCRVLAGPIAMEDGPIPGLRTHYVVDPFGNQLELVQHGR